MKIEQACPICGEVFQMELQVGNNVLPVVGHLQEVHHAAFDGSNKEIIGVDRLKYLAINIIDDEQKLCPKCGVKMTIEDFPYRPISGIATLSGKYWICQSCGYGKLMGKVVKKK